MESLLKALTGADIEKAVTAEDSDGWGEVGYSYDKKPLFLCDLQYTVASSEGGGEGGGENVTVVLKFTQNGESRYFEKTGRYMSFDGTTWDDDPPYEVFPHTVARIEYTTKKPKQ